MSKVGQVRSGNLSVPLTSTVISRNQRQDTPAQAALCAARIRHMIAHSAYKANMSLDTIQALIEAERRVLDAKRALLREQRAPL